MHLDRQNITQTAAVGKTLKWRGFEHVDLKENMNMYVSADKPFLQKQRSILRLLYGILQPTLFKDQVEEGMNYNPKENIDKYTVRTAGVCADTLLCVFSTTRGNIAC
jgi:hypothetical protein